MHSHIDSRLKLMHPIDILLVVFGGSQGECTRCDDQHGDESTRGAIRLGVTLHIFFYMKLLVVPINGKQVCSGFREDRQRRRTSNEPQVEIVWSTRHHFFLKIICGGGSFGCSVFVASGEQTGVTHARARACGRGADGS